MTCRRVNAESMSVSTSQKSAVAKLIDDNKGVLSVSALLGCVTRGEVRWQVSSGRWQCPCRGVVVTHSGELTDEQVLRVALMHAGPRAVLAGLTAARLDGFTGFGDRVPASHRPIYILAPPGYARRTGPPDLNVIMRYSRQLTEADVHPAREPRRTRIPRSILDAAAWHASDRGAMAIVASGVQQGLVRVDHLSDAVTRIGHGLPRRELIMQTLADIAGGAHALSELDFTRKVVQRFGLPEPSRQAGRTDQRGRQRWIDVLWDDWKVMVEIDGAQHMDALQYWDDMDRGNGLQVGGYRVLRFPAWVVRQQPEYVAAEILRALREAGYRG